jgi:hypothetical protein
MSEQLEFYIEVDQQDEEATASSVEPVEGK